MRIAIIGSGISGLGAALALSEQHDVQVFEKAHRFGGHANTVSVAVKGHNIAVDTGFIVYNNDNYPHLSSLFEHLGAPTKASDMSFGMSIKGGQLEYAGDNLDTVFAQRSNLFRPHVVKGFLEILRFNRRAAEAYDAGELNGLSLGQWLEQERFTDWFRDYFLLPMGGAIWSTPVDDMMAFPAENFVAFFRNHALLNGLRAKKQWRTVDGGSREYVSRIVDRLGARTHAGQGVVEISRVGGQPRLRFEDGAEAVFDQVVIAAHAPQAKAMIADLDVQERAILSAFETSQNRAILHSDRALMPRRRKVWSSWNFLSNGADVDAGRPAPITYWMNRLQGIPQQAELFVSLNPGVEPDPSKVHQECSYAHPLFTQAAFDAQGEIDAIQGRGGVWYAGAWLGYGFHEDGLRSGLRVAAALGAVPSWAGEEIAPMALPLAQAAE